MQNNASVTIGAPHGKLPGTALHSESMTDKNRPDNARDFDDVDVPTYSPSTGSSPASKSFGDRAQPPQQVGGSPETISFDSAAKKQPPPAETTQFAQTSEDYSKPAEVRNETVDMAAPPTQHFDPNTNAAPVAVAEAEEGPTPEEQKAADARAKREQRKADPPRRGTLDFGLLFVRIALALYLIVAGVGTFFGLGEAQGLSELETSFAGYALPQVLAIAVPTLQLIAGVFLLLGLVTPPLASMLGLVVTGFAAIHELTQSSAGLNLFNWPDAMWLSIVLLLVAFALQFTGPGVISFDFGRSWARRPLASSWIFVVIGIAILVVAWWFGAGVNPLS